MVQTFEVNLAKEIYAEVNYGLKCFQFYRVFHLKALMLIANNFRTSQDRTNRFGTNKLQSLRKFLTI